MQISFSKTKNKKQEAQKWQPALPHGHSWLAEGNSWSHQTEQVPPTRQPLPSPLLPSITCPGPVSMCVFNLCLKDIERLSELGRHPKIIAQF